MPNGIRIQRGWDFSWLNRDLIDLFVDMGNRSAGQLYTRFVLPGSGSNQ